MPDCQIYKSQAVPNLITIEISCSVYIMYAGALVRCFGSHMSPEALGDKRRYPMNPENGLPWLLLRVKLYTPVLDKPVPVIAGPRQQPRSADVNDATMPLA